MRPALSLALAWVVLTRVAELLLSRANLRLLAPRGGRLVSRDGLAGMVAVHALFPCALVLEEVLLGPAPLALPWRVAAAALFAAAEALRAWCIVALGQRWNVRVVVVPGAPPRDCGPYRVMRHPNYAAVVVGLAALPLALGLPWTAILCVPLQLLVLRRRIRVEEAALLRAQEEHAPTSPDRE